MEVGLPEEGRDRSLVHSHRVRLCDQQTLFQKTKRMEEELLARLQLLHSASTPEEKSSDKMDLLVEEKVSLGMIEGRADDFIE